MTFNRLILVAAACMLLTGLTVHTLTGPPPAQPTQSALTSPTELTPAPLPTAAGSTPPPSAAPPTLAVWKAAAAVELEGAAALHCSAKMAQGWLRVACEDPNGTGGTPKDLSVDNATLIDEKPGETGFIHKAWRTARGTVYTAARKSLLSLVCPFVEGTLVEARFEWTDRRETLVIRWDASTAEPRVKGTFRRLP